MQVVVAYPTVLFLETLGRGGLGTGSSSGQGERASVGGFYVVVAAPAGVFPCSVDAHFLFVFVKWGLGYG